jgi:hypothetical protein
MHQQPSPGKTQDAMAILRTGDIFVVLRNSQRGMR